MGPVDSTGIPCFTSPVSLAARRQRTPAHSVDSPMAASPRATHSADAPALVVAAVSMEADSVEEVSTAEEPTLAVAADSNRDDSGKEQNTMKTINQHIQNF